MSKTKIEEQVRLTAPGPGDEGKRMAGPVAGFFLRPAAGKRPTPATEAFLSFEHSLLLDSLDLPLHTPGFEAAKDISEAAHRTVVEVDWPILAVKPSRAPIAVYEPIGFLDYDDDEAFFQEKSEPEPPTPPVLTAFVEMAVPQAAAPGPANIEAGFDGFAAITVEVPKDSLKTLRPKLLQGPNPFAPKPQPAPAIVKTPAAVSKPVVVVQRSVAGASASAAAIKADPVVRQEPAKPVTIPATAPKPKMVPIRKPEPAEVAPSVADLPMLQLAQTEKSNGPKIIAAVLAVVLAGGGYFLFSGGKGGSGTPSSTSDSLADIAPGMALGGGGWTTTWGADAAVNKGKQISIYRPSMAMPDYRFEFRGQIERKAMGWIFRAFNSKNYYVMKLEVIKPGPNPLVALVKYAVIEGKETTRTQVMLPFEVKTDALYLVRIDVRGDKFTTYVQDKLVDYWTDARIKIGGTGFYTETGERSQIKSSQVSYLR